MSTTTPTWVASVTAITVAEAPGASRPRSQVYGRHAPATRGARSAASGTTRIVELQPLTSAAATAERFVTVIVQVRRPPRLTVVGSTVLVTTRSRSGAGPGGGGGTGGIGVRRWRRCGRRRWCRRCRWCRRLRRRALARVRERADDDVALRDRAVDLRAGHRDLDGAVARALDPGVVVREVRPRPGRLASRCPRRAGPERAARRPVAAGRHDRAVDPELEYAGSFAGTVTFRSSTVALHAPELVHAVAVCPGQPPDQALAAREVEGPL